MARLHARVIEGLAALNDNRLFHGHQAAPKVGLWCSYVPFHQSARARQPCQCARLCLARTALPRSAAVKDGGPICPTMFTLAIQQGSHATGLIGHHAPDLSAARACALAIGRARKFRLHAWIWSCGSVHWHAAVCVCHWWRPAAGRDSPSCVWSLMPLSLQES